MGRVSPTDGPGLQRNVESLASIGGAYDLVAFAVDYQHRDTLERHRLDTGAPSLLDLQSRSNAERRNPGSTHKQRTQSGTNS